MTGGSTVTTQGLPQAESGRQPTVESPGCSRGGKGSQ